MRSRESRLAALEQRLSPRPPTAADLAVGAALEMLVETHGSLVEASLVKQLAAIDADQSAGMDEFARASVRFVKAVEEVAPEAAAEFWSTVDFYSRFADAR